MSDIFDVLLVILIVSGIVFLYAAIYLLLKLSKTTDVIRDDVRRLTDETIPLMLNLQALADSAQESFEAVNEYKNSLSTSVQRISTVTSEFQRLYNIIHEQLEPSVIGLASTLSGLRKGIQTFIDTWRQPR